jgi:hypothetical protein
MSGLLLGMVLSVCTCSFHSTVTLPAWAVSTDFGTCSYHCFCPIIIIIIIIIIITRLLRKEVGFKYTSLLIILWAGQVGICSP